MAVVRSESHVVPRWAGAVLAVIAIGLVPWTIALGSSLPSTAKAANWDVAWTGFDAVLVIALLATSVATARHSAYLPSLATATATILVVDAWFDVVTSSAGAPRIEALIMAFVAELPLAVTCSLLARRATRR